MLRFKLPLICFCSIFLAYGCALYRIGDDMVKTMKDGCVIVSTVMQYYAVNYRWPQTLEELKTFYSGNNIRMDWNKYKEVSLLTQTGGPFSSKK